MSLAATYVDADTFTVSGDYTADFVINRKIRANCGVDGYKYTVVLSSSYSAPNTTVNLTADSDDLTANLTEVDWSVVKPGTAGNIPLHAHTDEDTGNKLDHGAALTGLSDDDHTGYARLAGRAGGQTIYGGNAANEDITIEPTSHATKTTAYVLLAPSGGNVGIGTSGPEQKLHVSGQSQFIDTSGFNNRAIIIGRTTTDAAAKSSAITSRHWLNSEEPVSLIGSAIDTAANSYVNIGGGYSNNNSATAIRLYTAADNITLIGTERMRIGANGGISVGSSYVATDPGAGSMIISGNVGIGTTSPDRLLHPEVSDAVTNAITYAQRLSHITSGTAAANFGVGLEMELEDDGGTNRVASYLETLWYDPATAAYKADVLLKAVDSAATREILRGRATGAAAAIGFLGASPVVRQAHIANPTDLATCITAVTSILAALENYGLLATS